MQDPFEQAEIAHYSESERRQYFESQKEYWDNYSIMTTALNKGLRQGLARPICMSQKWRMGAKRKIKNPPLGV